MRDSWSDIRGAFQRHRSGSIISPTPVMRSMGAAFSGARAYRRLSARRRAPTRNKCRIWRAGGRAGGGAQRGSLNSIRGTAELDVMSLPIVITDLPGANGRRAVSRMFFVVRRPDYGILLLGGWRSSAFGLGGPPFVCRTGPGGGATGPRQESIRATLWQVLAVHSPAERRLPNASLAASCLASNLTGKYCQGGGCRTGQGKHSFHAIFLHAMHPQTGINIL
jgi:hypothetical protein